MNDNKISVIIPIYNTSLYLEKCILSIIEQTYTNLEIILVNDGSADNSLEICYKYSKLDKRIRVLNKEHTGLSDSRNFGLRNSNGNYISFIDSDDYISKDMYKNMMNIIKKYNPDMIECSMNIIYKESNKINELKLNEPTEIKVFDNATGMKEFLLKRIQPSCCNKLFRKSLIGESIFHSVNRLEEYCFTWEMLEKSSKYIFLPNKYYYYHYLRQDSITKSDNNKSIMNYIEFCKYLEIHNSIYYPYLNKESQFYSYITCINTLKLLTGDLLNNCTNGDSSKIRSFTKYLLKMKNHYEIINNDYIKNIQGV